MEILIPLLLLVPYFLYFIFPVKFIPSVKKSDVVLEPPNLYIYSYQIHIHTQFSYDSLGKPEDVFTARDKNNVDYVIITDHEVDTFKYFADSRTLVGVERKINANGKLLGNLIEVEGLKIITHHFKEKYRWKLEKREDYIFELINLKDALLKSKRNLFFYILLGIFIYPISRKGYLKNFLKLIDTEYYVKRYLKEGWKNKVICGLDHHVKVYVREVGIRFLFPSYMFSFSLMRNFILSRKKITYKNDLLNSIKSESNLISFSDKPSIFWKEGRKLNVYSPYPKVLIRIFGKNTEFNFLGSNACAELDKGEYIACGYTYTFKLGSLFFGLRPLFITDLIKVD